MKLFIGDLSVPGGKVNITFDGETFKQYKVRDIKKKTISIPDSCTDYSKIKVTGKDKELSNIYYTVPLESFNNGNFNVTPNVRAFNIPDGVTSIRNYIFANCASLTSITIPDSVTSIRDQAFLSCTSLTSINIPDSVTSIGSSAFMDCTSLTSIDIPDSVTSIKMGAFRGCTSLTSITIPNSVTSIEAATFWNCLNLTDINYDSTEEEWNLLTQNRNLGLPETVTINFADDIYVIRELTESTKDTIREKIQADKIKRLFIKSPVTEIPDSDLIQMAPFYNCSSLTSVDISDSVTSIGNNAFYGCGIASINLGKSITRIGNKAFYNCKNLTSIDIPSSVTSIEDRAFSNSSLTSISIPNGVTIISLQAFAYCENLSSIILPSTITSIKKRAFYRCSNLRTINYLGTEEQWNNITKDAEWNNNCPAVINYLGEAF